MDPTAALNEILDEIKAGEPNSAMGRFEELHEWLVGGGFLPYQWAQNRGIRIQDVEGSVSVLGVTTKGEITINGVRP